MSRSSVIEDDQLVKSFLMSDDSDEDEVEDSWEEEKFDKDGEPIIPSKKKRGIDEDEDFSMFDDWRELEEYA